MNRPKIAILASGNGTTAEAFIRAGADGSIDATVGLIICNNPKAGIFDRVAALNSALGLEIQCLHISHLTNPPNGEELVRGQQTDAEEQAIMNKLKAGNYDAIVLMGYLKLVGPKLVEEFGWRKEYDSPYQATMLNTHPGLLPLTKGLYGIYAQSHTLSNNEPYGGHTLHVVAEAYDDGPVIRERKVLVEPQDTAETLFDRVQQSEKKYLPVDTDEFIKNRQEFLAKGGN
ncbi:MAG: formyltransferase family protein [Patescibacteria group bacterium]